MKPGGYQRLERAAPPPARPRAAGVVVPHKPSLGQRIGAWLVYVVIRTVGLTLRYRWVDLSGYFENVNPPVGHQFIYCIWHNRVPLCMKAYFGYAKIRTKTHGMASLVSASRDGGFLAEILEHFGVQPVRGSSSRRGQQALLELTRWARRGYDIGITPDGPRGPCYVVQAGVIGLAQLSGLPIIPVSYNLGWKIRLKTWDRAQIPLPFSRCEMIYGKPIFVPRDATEEQRAQLREELAERMAEITRD